MPPEITPVHCDIQKLFLNKLHFAPIKNSKTKLHRRAQRRRESDYAKSGLWKIISVYWRKCEVTTLSTISPYAKLQSDTSTSTGNWVFEDVYQSPAALSVVSSLSMRAIQMEDNFTPCITTTDYDFQRWKWRFNRTSWYQRILFVSLFCRDWSCTEHINQVSIGDIEK